jgi:hypothetical protein
MKEGLLKGIHNSNIDTIVGQTFDARRLISSVLLSFRMQSVTVEAAEYVRPMHCRLPFENGLERSD